MKKKQYEKPTMHVVVLQHQSHLLAESDGVHSLGGGLFDYGGSDEDYSGDVR